MTSGKRTGGVPLLPLVDVLDLKDAGINYQRVNVGLGEKGKSDLGQRLLYEGRRESSGDMEFWKGEDISRLHIAPKTNRFVRVKTVDALRDNERVILNKKYFAIVPKLIWRQTASCFIAAVDEQGIWFGRSIQGVTVKPAFRDLDYYYLAGVLNSAYMSYIYDRRVQEQGRVFPQIKFENIRALPIPIAPSREQGVIKQLVRQAVSAKDADSSADVSNIVRDLDVQIYRLYGLTPDEIQAVEDSGGMASRHAKPTSLD